MRQISSGILGCLATRTDPKHKNKTSQSAQFIYKDEGGVGNNSWVGVEGVTWVRRKM